MPELPDLTVYLECLAPKVVGAPLEALRLASPFVLRTVEPPPSALEGRRVTGLRRVGKRVVLELEAQHFLVVHLMIAGRLAWKARGVRLAGKAQLAACDFPGGSLVLTEAGTQRRASLHVVRGEEALRALDPGGAELDALDRAGFVEVLTRTNHTLKRALTDPRLLSGVGNAYSDEILHAARLSPVQLTANLDEAEWTRLHDATRAVLARWTERLRAEAAGGWPKQVTAFHPEMAVHGRFGAPCPDCGTKVQRIVYASRETNYCPTCQTGGRLLADRALSRLLKADWPRTPEELEERRARAD
ncbi:MAG: formamidopyrimidine-DNA glycosylase [Planctomycetes bacterium]|nr:formamidopyrimidine-DNA glycosylase [Planctomycetota bacterium]